ncbi:hypothetical protein QCA50_004308 [Cerrena zonata]|uniref:Uncharacterized protein n=1 Tax=Cerrena zonata TaxID=2478898 RepID=A0AAW0GNL1_9APHY
MASALHMHPWYRLPTLKRKTSLEYDSDLVLQGLKSPLSHSSSSTVERDMASLPKPKRRRCDNLEHGFSQLSLTPSVALQTPSVPPVASSSTPYSQPHASGSFSDASYNTNFVPTNVNFTSHEAEMHYPVQIPSADIPPAPVDNVGYSWYEPEKDRIVITDLGPSPPSTPPPPSETRRTEDDTDEPPLHISLPSFLLKRLNNRQSDSLPPLHNSGSDPSKALVLFRPLSIPTVEEPPSPPTHKSHRKRRESYGPSIGVADDDAIEAEDVPIIEEPSVASSLFREEIGRGHLHIEEIHDHADDDAMDIEY